MISEKNMSLLLNRAPLVPKRLIQVKKPVASAASRAPRAASSQYLIAEPCQKTFKYDASTDQEADKIAQYIALTGINYAEAHVSIGSDAHVFQTHLYDTIIPVRVIKFLACAKKDDLFPQYAFVFTNPHLQSLINEVFVKLRHIPSHSATNNLYSQVSQALFGAAFFQEKDFIVPWQRMDKIAKSWRSISNMQCSKMTPVDGDSEIALRSRKRSRATASESDRRKMSRANDISNDGADAKIRPPLKRGRTSNTAGRSTGGSVGASQGSQYAVCAGRKAFPHLGATLAPAGRRGSRETLKSFDAIRAPEMTYRRSKELITVRLRDREVYMTSKRIPRLALNMLTSHSVKLGFLGEFGIASSASRGIDIEMPGLNELISDVNNGQKFAASWLLSHVLNGRILGSDAQGSKTSWFPVRSERGKFVYEGLQLKRIVDTVGPLLQDSLGRVLLPVYGRMKVCVLRNLDKPEASAEWSIPDISEDYTKHVGSVNEYVKIGG